MILVALAMSWYYRRENRHRDIHVGGRPTDRSGINVRHEFDGAMGE